MTTTAEVVLLGGPWDRYRAALTFEGEQAPRRVQVSSATGGPIYERLDDPDTGAWLGAYVWDKAPLRLEPLP